MSIATVTSKGQLTLPKALRDELDIKPGDKVEFIKQGDHYVFKPSNRSVRDIFGMLKQRGDKPMSVEQMDEALGLALAEDDERIRAGH